MKQKIIFMGSTDFGIPSLESIHEKWGVSLVVTQPDKPKGRGLSLSSTPIKNKAIDLNIPILQPISLSEPEFLEQIKFIQPDIFCVIAFRILPKELFCLPKIAAFNIHGSLLPKYRGAAPINRAIINGESNTGLTSFILQEKVDAGNILLTKEINIAFHENFGDIYNRLAPIASDLTIETIELLLTGDYFPKIQNNKDACLAPKIFKADCEINWDRSSFQIYNHIRGLSPHPTAFTYFNNLQMKIYKAEITEDNFNLKSAEYLIINNRFIVGTGNNESLELQHIQMPGKKVMSSSDFIRGYRGEKRGFLPS